MVVSEFELGAEVNLSIASDSVCRAE
jgi:hypothetical protein